MITLDSLRTAVLSDQPWIELDKLVRAELSAGRLTRAIYDEIVALQDTIRDVPGYTDDADDAIGDTLDTLVGFCAADCQYKNPPVLPSEEEIAKLPRWARVAFAARCARRVLPLFERYSWPQSRTEMHLLKSAVWEAEEQRDITKAEALLNALDLIHAGTLQTATTTHSPALNALHIVACVSFALQLRNADTSVPTPEHVKFAFEAGESAARASDDPGIILVLRRDFDHIAKLAEWQKWDDDTPVPPEVFGPLWPERPPKGWPAVTDAPERTELALSLYPREAATTQVIRDETLNLFNALNKYHIVRSGVRLTLDQFRSLLPSLVPAEA
jgi:hypothetical protein